MVFIFEKTIENFLSEAGAIVHHAKYKRGELGLTGDPCKNASLLNMSGGFYYEIGRTIHVDNHDYFFNLLREAMLNSEFRGGGLTELEVYRTEKGIVTVVDQNSPWDFRKKVKTSQLFVETRNTLQNLCVDFSLRYDKITQQLVLETDEGVDVPTNVQELLERLSSRYGEKLNGITPDDLYLSEGLVQRFGMKVLGTGLEMFSKDPDNVRRWEVTYSDEGRQTIIMYLAENIKEF